MSTLFSQPDKYITQNGSDVFRSRLNQLQQKNTTSICSFPHSIPIPVRVQKRFRPHLHLPLFQLLLLLPKDMSGCSRQGSSRLWVQSWNIYGNFNIHGHKYDFKLLLVCGCSWKWCLLRRFRVRRVRIILSCRARRANFGRRGG